MCYFRPLSPGMLLLDVFCPRCPTSELLDLDKKVLQICKSPYNIKLPIVRMGEFRLKYGYLVEVILLYNRDIDECIDHKKQERKYISQTYLVQLKNDFSRNKTRFFAKHSSWLQNECSITVGSLDVNVNTKSSSVLGRPLKSFEDCSARSQQRKIKELR